MRLAFVALALSVAAFAPAAIDRRAGRRRNLALASRVRARCRARAAPTSMSPSPVQPAASRRPPHTPSSSSAPLSGERHPGDEGAELRRHRPGDLQSALLLVPTRIVLQRKDAKGVEGAIYPISQEQTPTVQAALGRDATFDRLPEGEFDVVVVTTDTPQRFAGICPDARADPVSLARSGCDS